MQGTGFYIWQVDKLPEVKAVIAALKRADARWVSIKVQDGQYRFNQKGGNDKLLLAFMGALREAGIEVGGWGWINPLPTTSPGMQAGITSERIQKLDLAHFLIDAEHYVRGVVNAPWKTSKDKKRSAETYMNQLDINKKFPVGLSSYRYISVHQEFPFRQFVIHENSRLVAPQVYPLGAHNFGAQLRQSYAEYAALKPFSPEFPFIPMGASWGQNLADSQGKLYYWEPTAADLKDFIATAKELKCPAWGFWSLDWVLQHNRVDWLDAISGQPYIPPPPPVVTWPRVMAMGPSVRAVNLRSAPEVSNGNLIGVLNPPAKPLAFEERQIGKDTWCRIGENIWIAKEYGQQVYFNYV